MMSGLLPPLSSRTSTMSHPTCYCRPASLDRCDRCDLLVNLEGFHLMSVARTPQALVLDIESCNQLVGCPSCGVIAQGHGRVVVEVIDAPWAGIPARIRWHKRRWRCLEKTCQTVTFLEHDERVCAPRARLGMRAICWAIRQLRFEGATIAGLARQLATTWNIVWSHIKPCLQAASDDPTRFTGVQVLGVDEHVWHHQGRRRHVQQDTLGHRGRKGDPLYQIRLLLRTSRRRLTPRQKERLREALVADEAHISVEVAYHCAQQVREVFHQATPAQGRRLATHLIEHLPTWPIPEFARLGRTLRKWKDAFLAYLDTGGASNGPTEAINGHYRTRQTHRQRLPQPHQLQTPNAPHRRRLRRLHPHSTLKSRKSAAVSNKLS
ncbi:transposase [Actinomyces sp.]